MGDQLAGDLGERGESHEDHQRFGVPDFGPIDGLHGVAGDEGDGRSMFAMGERDSGVGGDAQRRGHAGYDLKRDAGIGQRFGFFAAAAEDEGVAAFEADYGESAARPVDEHAADFVLREFVRGFLFADVDAFGAGRGEIEEGRVGEVIVENGVGLLEDAAAFDSDELRVARPGSDEVDLHGHGANRGLT